MSASNDCVANEPAVVESVAPEKVEGNFDAELDKEIKELKEAVVSNENKPQSLPAIKHEWYQTESTVTISVLAKNVAAESVDINTKDRFLSVKSKDQEKLKLDLSFNLAHPIKSEATQIKFLATKVEIKLTKGESIHWKTLELDANDVVLTKAVIEQEKKPEYPSSSRKAKNWDKIAADVEKEEKDEKVEGDAALNKLFQQIYRDGSDEVRKAMNKSFTESGGTVLSTNWGEVGAKKLDVKAPDGMEWKNWDK